MLVWDSHSDIIIPLKFPVNDWRYKRCISTRKSIFTNPWYPMLIYSITNVKIHKKKDILWKIRYNKFFLIYFITTDTSNWTGDLGPSFNLIQQSNRALSKVPWSQQNNLIALYNFFLILYYYWLLYISFYSFIIVITLSAHLSRRSP